MKYILGSESTKDKGCELAPHKLSSDNQTNKHLHLLSFYSVEAKHDIST